MIKIFAFGLCLCPLCIPLYFDFQPVSLSSSGEKEPGADVKGGGRSGGRSGGRGWVAEWGLVVAHFLCGSILFAELVYVFLDYATAPVVTTVTFYDQDSVLFL